MSGATSCMDALGHALCDPGDIIITPTPVYGRIISDFSDVAEVCMDFLDLLEVVCLCVYSITFFS